MNLNIRLVLLLGISLSFFSCSKKVVGELGEKPEKLPRRKTGDLIAAMDSLMLSQPQSYYCKITTKYKDTNNQITLKSSIRIVRDSAINALIKYATFPVASALITKDSLIVIDKRKKCYKKGELGYLKEQFGVSFDFSNVQELLWAKPVGYDPEQKYFQIHDPYHYIISSHRKREIRKSDKNKKEKWQDDVIFKYYISPELNKLERLEINSKSDTANIEVRYFEYEQTGPYLLPQEMSVLISTPRNRLELNLRYGRSEVDVPQQMILIIPENYDECP